VTSRSTNELLNSQGQVYHRISTEVADLREEVRRNERAWDKFMGRITEKIECMSLPAEKQEATPVASVRKCADCGRQIKGDWTRCSTCADKVRAERKLEKKKRQAEKAKEKGKEAAAVPEKQESIQTNSQMITPKHINALVKMIGKAQDGKQHMKNGVVVRGNLITVAHGPINEVNISSTFTHRQEARERLKVNETQDLAIYSCPSGSFDKVSVRAPVKGEECYITFYKNPGDVIHTTAQGKILDIGDQEKVHGSHTCSTPKDGGASGSPIWATKDGYLIGIHTGAADPTGPNKFAMLTNEWVWTGQGWPTSTARPEN